MSIATLRQERLPITLPHSTRSIRHIVASLFALTLAMAPAASAQSSVTVSWNANPEADIDGYVLYLGTATGVYPTILDVGKSTTRVLTGLSSTSTYFCAVQAYNTSGLTSSLSGEITFTTQTSMLLFNNWASGAGLTGTNALPMATPFDEGVPNLTKFAFNMTPGAPDNRILVKGSGTAGLPHFALDQSGAQPAFTVEFLRRKGSGLVYTPKYSTNLVNMTPMTGTTSVTSINTTWERVVVRTNVSLSSMPRMFGTVEVMMP